MLHTKVSSARWLFFFFQCKEILWVGCKRINEDGQMGEEPINKTTFSTTSHIRLDFNHLLRFSGYQKIEKVRSIEIY